MGTTYTSTIEVRCWKEHTCICCGAVYAYEFVRSIKGSASNAEKASVNARAAVQKALATDTDLHPCPTCGMYQPDMIGQRRAAKHWVAFWLSLVALGIILIVRAAYGMQTNTATWSATIIAGVMALWIFKIDTTNPNGNPAANLQLAAGRVSAGQIRHQAGRPMPGAQDAAQPGRSMVGTMALLMAFTAVALAASPELLRIVRGWPLNADCYPPVVGPGDDTRIYMNQKINSVKGYWRGKPEVAIYEAGTPTHRINALAESNQNDWGSTISAKSSEKNTSSTPWVRVTLPEEPTLAGKTVSCDIALDVRFPEMAGSSSFETHSQKLARSVTMQLAPAGAGDSYNSWWWEATALGVGSLLLSAILLAVAASALQKRAAPTRTYTLT